MAYDVNHDQCLFTYPPYYNNDSFELASNMLQVGVYLYGAGGINRKAAPKIGITRKIRKKGDEEWKVARLGRFTVSELHYLSDAFYSCRTFLSSYLEGSSV